MRQLELLAPARDANIGIAAIDCGADAVYIAGPQFGARQAALALGKTNEAIAYLEKYVELSPNAKDANQMRFNIAATAQKSGDKEKAKNYYQQVLSDPKLGAAAKQQFDALNK